jgi:hypothetical protein
MARCRDSGRGVTFALAVFIVLTACTKPTPTPSLTGAPVGTNSVAPPPKPSGSCANPLMPVSENVSWTYLLHSNLTSDNAYTDTVTQLKSDGFTISTAFPDLTKDVKWSCTSQGLVALQFGGSDSASLSTSGSTASFETTNVTGVTLPPNPQPGDKWSQSFDITGTQAIGGTNAKTDGTITLDFTATKTEHVNVPAGSYDALAVDQNADFALTVDVSGISQDVHLSFTGTTWYAPDVGMVKSVSTGSFTQGGKIESTIELTKFHGP